VRELFAVMVLPLAIVSVADVAGAVIVTLLMLVAVATPRTGVVNVGDVNVGDVANTALPEPVSSVNAAAKLAEVGV
jgi:ABC-type thiamine transport system ATPase subunit